MHEISCQHIRYASSSDSDEGDLFHSVDFDVRQPFMRMWLECRLHSAMLKLKTWNKNKNATLVPFPPYPDAVDGIDAICRQYEKGNKEMLLNEVESLQLSVDTKTADLSSSPRDRRFPVKDSSPITKYDLLFLCFSHINIMYPLSLVPIEEEFSRLLLFSNQLNCTLSDECKAVESFYKKFHWI